MKCIPHSLKKLKRTGSIKKSHMTSQDLKPQSPPYNNNEAAKSVRFSEDSKSRLLINNEELKELLLGTKEMHSMIFDYDGVLKKNRKTGWKLISDFICNDSVSKTKLDFMKKEKEKEMIKRIETEMELENLQFNGKIPFYLKLREAKIRNIKLTSGEKNLVDIHDKFDEIRKNERELNNWISNLSRKVSPRKIISINNLSSVCHSN